MSNVMRPQAAFNVSLSRDPESGFTMPPGTYVFALTLEHLSLGWGVENTFYTYSCGSALYGHHAPLSKQSFPSRPLVVRAPHQWNVARVGGLGMRDVSPRETIGFYISSNGGRTWVKFDQRGVPQSGIVSHFGYNLYQRNKAVPVRFAMGGMDYPRRSFGHGCVYDPKSEPH